eukprot:TRINITY_DN3578_c0_g1_i2.p1 TRINITY_DN3578_c0_g1~~TRINITY_DN3578_c0_g1_i2.p1  ORF type:complete len:198 (-),score=40.78 TRINITY_DN3578_c0_g1_i2:553-1146(-)
MVPDRVENHPATKFLDENQSMKLTCLLDETLKVEVLRGTGKQCEGLPQDEEGATITLGKCYEDKDDDSGDTYWVTYHYEGPCGDLENEDDFREVIEDILESDEDSDDSYDEVLDKCNGELNDCMESQLKVSLREFMTSERELSSSEEERLLTCMYMSATAQSNEECLIAIGEEDSDSMDQTIKRINGKEVSFGLRNL